MPCNNDLLAANFIDDGERLWVIDYEYAGNNDPCFELGNIWSESEPRPSTTSRCSSTATTAEHLRHKVARARLLGLMAKYGWTLWASIQAAVSPIEFDFWSWGMEKYELRAGRVRRPRLRPAARPRPAAPTDRSRRSVGTAGSRGQSPSVLTTSGSMVCFGPGEPFLAESSHQIDQHEQRHRGDDRVRS